MNGYDITMARYIIDTSADTEPLVIDDRIDDIQWTIIDDGVEVNTFKHKTKLIFSEVDVYIVLGREQGFYIFTVMLPGMLVVIISYCSFWVDKKAVPARVTLCIIPVLTAILQLNNGYAKLPKISYTTWLLNFLYTNVVFTTIAMFELGFINWLEVSKGLKEKRMEVLLEMTNRSKVTIAPLPELSLCEEK
jgi:hypothetical protein